MVNFLKDSKVSARQATESRALSRLGRPGASPALSRPRQTRYSICGIMVRHPAADPHLITKSDALAEFCHGLAHAPYITIDTEFLREKTYWPILCLVQIAGPEPDQVAAIDTLAPGLDLAPLAALLKDTRVTKVFHAARQDVEIFFRLTGS